MLFRSPGEAAAGLSEEEIPAPEKVVPEQPEPFDDAVAEAEGFGVDAVPPLPAEPAVSADRKDSANEMAPVDVAAEVPPAPVPRPATPGRTEVPVPAPVSRQPAAPQFDYASQADNGWFAGAGDEEEDADDDGAGYGSLAAVGLGKTHAARAEVGQRGEAGLPDAKEAREVSSIPKGKPQDFRLREALAELQRVA